MAGHLHQVHYVTPLAEAGTSSVGFNRSNEIDLACKLQLSGSCRRLRVEMSQDRGLRKMHRVVAMFMLSLQPKLENQVSMPFTSTVYDSMHQLNVVTFRQK